MTPSVRKLLVVVVLAGCTTAVAWMYLGRGAGPDLAGNANVVGGLAGVAALMLSGAAFWPRRAAVAMPGKADGPLGLALDYLARETLSVWQKQAKARRVTTPAPALVSWRWGGPDVAAPTAELIGGDKRPALLTQGEVTRLRELYGELPEPGRVVILGGPGAGKTTAMLLLLIDVLSCRVAGADEPVPVWLTMGGWKPEMPLLNWIATVIDRDFPGLAAFAGPDTAAALLRTGRIALFFDGLDELPEDLRGPALHAIDEAAQRLPVVLTSRPSEYRAATGLHRLWNAAVIDLLPVEVDDACAFLLHQQVGARRDAWLEVTDALRRHPDSVAALTLRDPLALNLARDTYTHTNAAPADLLDHASPDALRRHLLNRVLVLAYPDPADYTHAVRWLTWIADCLDGSRDIRWWEIPTWLPGARRNSERGNRFMSGFIGASAGATSAGLLGGLAGGCIFVLVVALVDRRRNRSLETRRRHTGATIAGLLGGMATGVSGFLAETHVHGRELDLVMGAMGAFVGALVGQLSKSLTTRRGDEPRAMTLRLPRRQELPGVGTNVLKGGLGVGALVGLYLIFAWLPMGPMGEISYIIWSGLQVVLAAMPMVGLTLVLNFWSKPVPTMKAVTPVHSYQADRRRGAVAGVVGGLVVGLLAGHVIGYPFGLAFGVAFGLAIAPGPAFELVAAEMWSAFRGRPVAFMPLLRIAAERQVLRQAGTVYQFRHAALQDLLGTDPRFRTESVSTWPAPSRTARRTPTRAKRPLRRTAPR